MNWISYLICGALAIFIIYELYDLVRKIIDIRKKKKTQKENEIISNHYDDEIDTK